MKRNLLVVNGHPDPRPERFCAALCDAYEAGARADGWTIDRMSVGTLPIPTPDQNRFPENMLSELVAASARIRTSDRIVIIYPLWLDRPPIGLRNLFSFVEQDDRYDDVESRKSQRVKARIVVTMNMPAFMHRARDLRTAPGMDMPDALNLPGVAPDAITLIGCVDVLSADQRQAWLDALAGVAETDLHRASLFSRLSGAPRRWFAQNFL